MGTVEHIFFKPQVYILQSHWHMMICKSMLHHLHTILKDTDIHKYLLWYQRKVSKYLDSNKHIFLSYYQQTFQGNLSCINLFYYQQRTQEGRL